MSYIELEAQKTNQIPKILIPRNLITGTVIEVGSWSGVKQKKDKAGNTVEVPSEKIVLTVKVEGYDTPLQCWMNALIKKGSDPSYNTLSYNNLDNLTLLGDLNQVKSKAEETKTTIDLKAIEAFWYTKLINKKIKFIPETITSKDGEKYSVIQTIEGFANEQ